MAEAPYIIARTNQLQADGEIILSSNDIEGSIYNRTKHQFTVVGVGAVTGTCELWGKIQGIRETSDNGNADDALRLEGFLQLKDAFGEFVIIDLADPMSYIIEGVFQGFKLVPVAISGPFEFSVVGWA